MTYSESLAGRVRDVFVGRRWITEKKMFGGVGFMLHGNMCVGIWQTSLIVRLGPEQATIALKEPNVVEFDITGRPMKGWALVEAEGLETDQQLREWIERAVDFVETLPKKNS
ncbi:MAG: TfoX/Sxy family protein [Pirellulales bacterium]|nr:TfoX/Sxy family protein [Pirellulales bacterium]